MKITAVILLAACLSASATGKAQKVSLTLRDAPLEKALKEIKRQTGLDLLYTVDVLQHARPVTIELRNADLRQALDQCFKEQPLTYTIVENVIVVKLKPVTKAEGVGEEIVALPIDVKGRVVDTAGNPVAGASVTVKGDRTKGTTTDGNGYFELKGVEEDAVLVVSGVNIERYEVRVGGKNELSTIKVRNKVVQGETVVIEANTGYQKVRPNEITGSVVVITKEQLDQRIAPNIISKLEGITNGLVFNKDAINGTNKLRIRGESTIFANPNPLIVVDNFPYDGDINNLNPNDIESVTILKDAAAASIWGVQAGNGVIVITTKKGRFNRPLNIELNSNLTFSQKPDLYYSPQISSADFIEFEKKLFDLGYYDGQGVFTNPTMKAISPVVEILNDQRNGLLTSTQAATQIENLKGNDYRADVLRYMYQRPIQQQHQVNLSGGTNKLVYYFSAGYDQDFPGLKGNKNERITVSSQATYKPTRNFEFKSGLFFVENSLSNNGNLFIPNLYPYMKLADEQGNPLSVPQHRALFEDTISNYGFLDWKYYPIDERKNTSKSNRVNDFRILTSVSKTLFNSLKAELSYQFQRSLAISEELIKPESYEIRNQYNTFAILNGGYFVGSNYNSQQLNRGLLDIANSESEGHYFRGGINFNRTWGRHSVAAITGFEARQTKTTNNSNRLWAYDQVTGVFTSPDNFNYYTTFPSLSSERIANPGLGVGRSSTLNRFRSYFANLSYDFDHRYTVSGSVRLDGSNYFGVESNKKTVPLWSVGGKWDINNEKFYNVNWLPELSMRVTYGYNGNLARNLAAITTISYSAFPDFYLGLPYATIENIPNPELRWEKTAHFNFGINFTIARNVLSGSIEYYNKNGDDLIGYTRIDPTTGVNEMAGNFSSMKSKGLDFRLTLNQIQKSFKWSSSIIFNQVNDRITRYDISPSSYNSYLNSYNVIIPQVGRSLFSLYSYKWAGLDPTNGDPRIILGDTINKDFNPSNSSQIKLSDLHYSGRYNPPMSGAFLNSFSWRGFNLAVNISYKLGHYFRRNSVNYSFLMTDFWQHAGGSDYAFRWQNSGDENITDVPSFVYPNNVVRDLYYTQSNILVEKGDHIRLQYVNLIYNFNEQLTKKLTLQGLQVYLYLNNVGILWRANKKNLDPDYPYLNAPPSRSLSFGVKATL